MKKVMIITLGTGRGIENGLAKSIVTNNPEEIVFITTEASLEDEMIDKIIQSVKILYDRDLYRECVYTKVLTDSTDIKSAYDATRDAIELAQKRGFSTDDIYLDFTSGTKAMTIGAFLAAIESECRNFTYIGGFQREPETGRVITGSEIVMTFNLNNIISDTPINLSNKLSK